MLISSGMVRRKHGAQLFAGREFVERTGRLQSAFVSGLLAGIRGADKFSRVALIFWDPTKKPGSSGKLGGGVFDI